MTTQRRLTITMTPDWRAALWQAGKACQAGITQCAHLIGRGVDGRIEIGGAEGHGVSPF